MMSDSVSPAYKASMGGAIPTGAIPVSPEEEDRLRDEMRLYASSQSRLHTVLVPGTYDPITFGHVDVIARALRIADRVVVGVAASKNKRLIGTMFTLDERVELARQCFVGIDQIEVMPMRGLVIDFAHEVEAGAIVKGMRSLTDFEYEFQQANVNHHFDKNIETIFIMASARHTYISSSMARELASFGADVKSMVPAHVAQALHDTFHAE